MLDVFMIDIVKMKKEYLAPRIMVLPIDSNDDLMENSIPIFMESEDDKITESSEVLINKNSIWE